MKPEYESLAEALAVSFSKTTGFSVDVLIDPARTAAMESIVRYNQARTMKESSFVYMCIRNGLSDFVKREGKREEVEENGHQEMLNTGMPSIPQFVEFVDKINKAPEDCKFIAELLFGEGWNEELGVEPSCPPKLIRGAIRRYLGKCGWNKERIDSAFVDIREKILN